MWFKPVYIGLLAGILTSVSMLPQLIRIIRKKESGDISVTMLAVLVTGLGLWVGYGFLLHDLPLIVTNGFSFLLNLLVIFFSIKYRKRE